MGLTQEQLRDLIEDTMASWALEGMSPTPEQRESLRALAEGHITLEQFRAKIRDGT